MDVISNIDLVGDLLQISAGAVVIAGTSGRIDIGAANAPGVLGIATQTRAAGDVRPLTYTRKGMVHAVKDATGITVGDRLKVGAQGMVTPAAANGSEASLEIGKALETSVAAVGTVVVIELTL
jgi:hypothetical protein